MMSGVESPAGTFVHRPAGAEEARGAGILAGSEVGFRRFFETFVRVLRQFFWTFWVQPCAA